MKAFHLIALAATCAAYVFKPENHESFKNPYVPALIDYSESQYDVPSGSSYWVSSFVSTNDSKQYLALSHILTTTNPSPVCRSSVLDLETLEYWVDLTYCSSQNQSASDRSGPLNADYGTYNFGATTEDSISSMYAQATTNKSFSLDLKWESSSKVVQNGGGGLFAFGPGPTNATEWGIPAAKTSGTIHLNQSTLSIDPENSFSWYDRQISYGAPKNWTWFQINFPSSHIKVSTWAYDLGPPSNTLYQFATVRDGNSLRILAYTLTPDPEKTWTSPQSGLTYPLRWRLDFENGDYLHIQSIRADQEMYGSLALVDSAYEGFITVSGKFLGQKKGFGVVEMVTAYEV